MNTPIQVGNEIVSMNMVGSAALSAVLDLVDQIPDELLTMDDEAYASLIRAKAKIKDIQIVRTVVGGSTAYQA